MMKKKIMLIFTMLIFIPGVVFADGDAYYENYYGVKMSEEEYNNLVELGFSESEIEYMLEDDFNYNNNFTGELVSDNTNYYVNITRYDATGKIISDNDIKISKEDYMRNSAIEPLGFTDGLIQSEYKELRTTISKVDSTEFRYKVNLKWTKFPSTRSYDIIGIGIDSHILTSGDAHFSQTYCILNFCKTDTKTNDITYDFTGIGASFALPTDTITKLESTLYFNVIKLNSNSTVTSHYAYGDYSHATKKISGGNATKYTVGPNVGIVLESDIKGYYDTISPSIAQWTGTW